MRAIPETLELLHRRITQQEPLDPDRRTEVDVSERPLPLALQAQHRAEPEGVVADPITAGQRKEAGIDAPQARASEPL